MTNETFCHVVRSATGAAALFAAATLRAATICVSQTASEAWVDGATLCTTIADGVAAAATDGDTVILDVGTYVLAADLEVAKAITITSRNGKDLSIIDGNNSKVVKFAAEGTTLDSVTITRCGATYASCIGLAVSTGCTISNCVFRQNGNDISGRWNERNLVSNYAMSDAAQNLIFSCCIVTNNYAKNGPRVWVKGDSRIENCYFADNRHEGAGNGYPGICVHASGSAVVRNNTIVNNRSYTDTANYQTQAVYVDGSATVVVENNIIYGNTKGKTSPSPADWGVGTYTKGAYRLPVPTTVFVYNVMTDISGIEGDGNIAGDPLFKENNLDLYAASPCRGKANANAPKLDLYGNSRPSPAAIGAVEYIAGDEMEVALSVSASTAVQPATVVLTAVIGGSYTEPLSYAFDLDGDGETDETNSSGSLTLADVGVYLPSVTVMDALDKTATAQYAGEIIVYPADKTVYVDSSSANSVKPYATASTAAVTLADAFAICPAGGIVRVAGGNYALSEKRLIDGISIKGDGNAILTRSGSGSYSAFEIASGEVSGLVFEGEWQTSSGAATVIVHNGGIVSNCVFRNVQSTTHSGNGSVEADGGLVVCCTVSNIVCRRLCGIALSGTAVAESCLVANCRNVNIWNSGERSTACGLYIKGGATARNCTVAGCRGEYFGDPALLSPACAVGGDFSGLIVNCVFADNARQFEPGGEYVTTNDVALGAERVSCCAVKDAQCDYSDYTGMVTDGISFKDGTWIPASGSSLVNAGSSAVVLASSVDLLGNPRFVGRVDIGCCEASSSPGLTIIVR